MTPMQAICPATASGKPPNIIFAAEDPLADVRALNTVEFVMAPSSGKRAAREPIAGIH